LTLIYHLSYVFHTPHTTKQDLVSKRTTEHEQDISVMLWSSIKIKLQLKQNI